MCPVNKLLRAQHPAAEAAILHQAHRAVATTPPAEVHLVTGPQDPRDDNSMLNAGVFGLALYIVFIGAVGLLVR